MADNAKHQAQVKDNTASDKPDGSTAGRGDGLHPVVAPHRENWHDYYPQDLAEHAEKGMPGYRDGSQGAFPRNDDGTRATQNESPAAHGGKVE